ncbi:MAG: hypothetical protein ACTH6A_04040 [Brachybacterium tyrofermentans]|uniref:hypothetical protein n=1 Tax=Brachybacterium tyrofermentans TaxID=47848 RepID=UPI003F8F6530
MTQSVAPSCPEHQDGSAGTVDPFAYDVELAPAADVSDSSRADSDAGETILEIMKDTDEDHWAHESGIDGSLDEDCPNGHLN